MQVYQDKNLMVAIYMVTYNHEKFIGEAIEGVIKQQTSHRFRLFIGEDCSTDLTKSICLAYQKKYPEIIEVTSTTSNNLKQNVNNTFTKCFNSKAKYIAMCEGDDYWIDPNKLQRQINFLESNPDYSICWTKYKILYQQYIELGILNDPDWLTIIGNKKIYDIDLNNIFNPYSTYTVTAMIVKDKFDLSVYINNNYSKDDTIYCLCLSNGKGAILNFFSSVYRVHNESSYSNITLLKKRYLNFLSIEEIIKKLHKCNIPNLKHYRNTMLLEAFNISVKDNYSIYTSINLYYKIILYCKMSEKINASRQISKGFLAKISRRLQ